MSMESADEYSVSNEKENSMHCNSGNLLQNGPEPSAPRVQIEIIEDQELGESDGSEEKAIAEEAHSERAEVSDSAEEANVEGMDSSTDAMPKAEPLQIAEHYEAKLESPRAFSEDYESLKMAKKAADNILDSEEQTNVKKGVTLEVSHGNDTSFTEKNDDIEAIVQDLAQGHTSSAERPGIFNLMAKSRIFNPEEIVGVDSPGLMAKPCSSKQPNCMSKETLEDIKYTRECLRAALPADSKIPLKEELLNRPPFRFIHDVALAILKDSEFTKEESDSHFCGQSKIRKLGWLAKLKEIIERRTNSSLSVVRFGKVVAGKETSNTRFLLRMVCKAAEVSKVNCGGSSKARVELPPASEILVTAEADPNRRRSMLELQSHSVEQATQIKARKLRINVNAELLDGKLQRTAIARLSLLRRIVSNSNNGTALNSEEETDLDDDCIQGHAALLEHHIRKLASAYTMIDKTQNCTKSQSLRRASDPDKGIDKASSFLCKTTHLYISPFERPSGSAEVTIKSLPRMIFDKSSLSCLCVLSLIRLGLKDSAFPKVSAENLPTFLTVLDFSHNAITRLPAMFLQCWKLVELRLRDNEIVQIDAGNFKCLVLLDLRQNPLTGKPRRIEECQKLRYLYLRNPQTVKLPFKNKRKSELIDTRYPAKIERSTNDFDGERRSISPDIQHEIPECLDLSAATQFNQEIQLRAMIVAINIDKLFAKSMDRFLPGKDEEVMSALKQMPNAWQFWVYSGRLSFSKRHVYDEAIHYLGLKPYDETFDPPVFLPLLHRWLMQQFDIVNCTLCRRGKLCKFTIIPKDQRFATNSCPAS